MSRTARFAGIPKNQERRQSIQMLVSKDHQSNGGQLSGMTSIKVDDAFISEYLKREREDRNKFFRKARKCFKPKEHTAGCVCANMARGLKKREQQDAARNAA